MHLDAHAKLPDTFISTSAAYPPTTTSRTYGGHVIAQAGFAACHTIPYGLHIHSITGYFLSIGDTRYPFRYVIRRTRDGGIYSVRTVEAFQDLPGKGETTVPMFIGIVGFKRDEANYHKAGHKKRRRDFGHQGLPRDWLKTEYGEALGNRRFEDMPVCQGMDALWPEGTMSVKDWKKRGDVFPGLQMRKVDISEHNGVVCEGALQDDGEGARRWKCLLVYRYVDETENEKKNRLKKTSSRKKTAADDELNHYACAHIYASDRNSLFTTQRAIGLQKSTGQIGSLSHTVNFHGGVETLRMLGEDGRRKEFVQESWAGSSGDDRVCHDSRIWDRETGRILATTVQDGMMRIHVTQNTNIMDGDLILRREAKL